MPEPEQPYSDGVGTTFEVARRLRKHAPNAALVGRVGGDEFVVTLRTEDVEAALDLAAQLREQIRDQMVFGTLTLDVNTAVGVVVHPDHGSDPASLLQRADLATRAAKATPGNIQSIERAAAILRLLSGRTRRLGVVDLAGELGLSKGTVHGLLRTLQHVGFVEQDPETGKYQLGAALLHMGSSYLDGNELRTRALNWSDSLAARTQEAVRIGTLHEGQVLIDGVDVRTVDPKDLRERIAPVPQEAVVFGATVWSGDYVILPAAKLYKPIWEYDPKTLANDLSVHLYGLGTATALRVLTARS